ncbi:HAD family hydrolase [Myxococcus qinghaiensis]|uniref:HAD family hydrolase n=1 Tax=Myxococcus qinghaiensis TaxID=2906758 RepID=UPI0020A77776|nr:HAD family phosphatase [Myxococcus qinghaiensis]MCP3162624.1 HAD family phosphatase [Myxococcus qinghaiensis]
MRRLAVLDLDGTLTPDTLGLLLVREMVARGACEAELGQEFVSMVARHHAGDPDFYTTLAEVYQSLGRVVAGVAVPTVERTAEDVWAQARGRLFGFVRPLVRMLKSNGFLVALISGGPIELVHLVAHELGIDVYRAAVLDIRNSRYTGRVLQGPGLLGGKPSILRELEVLHQVCLSGSFAMGNSASDAEVFQLVGLPVAFEPTRQLAGLAARHGWQVVDRHDVLRVLPALLARGAEGEDSHAPR